MIPAKLRAMSVFLCFFLGFAVPVFAYTVSFIVVETGPVPERAGFAGLWESGMMDVFFNAGHIVSNAHSLRTDRETFTDFPGELQGDFDEARQGGVDFFIMALLDYRVSGETPVSSGAVTGPRQVSLKVFRVNPYQQVYEQGYSGPMRDELTRAKNAARSILPHLRDDR